MVIGSLDGFVMGWRRLEGLKIWEWLDRYGPPIELSKLLPLGTIPVKKLELWRSYIYRKISPLMN